MDIIKKALIIVLLLFYVGGGVVLGLSGVTTSNTSAIGRILQITGFILASVSIYIPIAIYQRHKLHSLFNDYMEEE